METPAKARAVVLGGAGFIGSNLCRVLCEAGFEVTAVDGLFPLTTGSLANLEDVKGRLEVIAKPVEEVPELARLIDGAVVIDAMGWTCHWEALEDPKRDLALNVSSHLTVIGALAEAMPQLLVYLGSSYQYGRSDVERVTEDTPFNPMDIQGIHKVAAEQHYRVASGQRKAPVVALRFGNTFGRNQPVDGRDIGLIGGFIRTILHGDPIKVLGRNRKRCVLFAEDLARVLVSMAKHDHQGFSAFNLTGHYLSILDLAHLIVAAADRGAVQEEQMTEALRKIDVGNLQLDETRLTEFLGPIAYTPIEAALAETVEDFSRRSQRDADRAGLS